MFSIASINDGAEAPVAWDSIAPTKEAEEARLMQMYQDALLQAQKGNISHARQLFESIVADGQMVSPAQDRRQALHGPSTRGPMEQLRFLALKNLGGVYEREGASFSPAALQAYMKAAELDSGDVVLWHRLGQLASRLGQRSLARTALEAGLLCSPRHLGCLEKLLDLLEAVGDEVSALPLVARLQQLAPERAYGRGAPRSAISTGLAVQPDDAWACEGQHGAGGEGGQATCNLTVPTWPALCTALLASLDADAKGGESGLPGAADVQAVSSLVFMVEGKALSLFSQAQPGELAALEEPVSAGGKEREDVCAMSDGDPVAEGVDTQGAPLAGGAGQALSVSIHGALAEETVGNSTCGPGRSVDADDSVGMGERRSSRRKRVSTGQKQAGLLEERDERLRSLRDRAPSIDADALLAKCLPPLGAELHRRGLRELAGPTPDAGSVQPWKKLHCDRGAGQLSQAGGSEQADSRHDDEASQVLAFLRGMTPNSGAAHVALRLVERLACAAVETQRGHSEATLAALLVLERRTRAMQPSRDPRTCICLAELCLDAASMRESSAALMSSTLLEDLQYHMCHLVGRLASQELANWQLQARVLWLSAGYNLGFCDPSSGLADLRRCASLLEEHDPGGLGCPLAGLRQHAHVSLSAVQARLRAAEAEACLTKTALVLVDEQRFKEAAAVLTAALLPPVGSCPEALEEPCAADSLGVGRQLEGLERLLKVAERAFEAEAGEGAVLVLRCHERRLRLLLGGGERPGAAGGAGTRERQPAADMGREPSLVLAEALHALSRTLSTLPQDAAALPSTCAGLVAALQLHSAVAFCETHRAWPAAAAGARNLLSPGVGAAESTLLLESALALARLQVFGAGAAPSLQLQVELVATLHHLLGAKGLCCFRGAAFLKFAISFLSRAQHELGQAPGDTAGEEVGEVQDPAVDTALSQAFLCLYGVDLRGAGAGLLAHDGSVRACADFGSREECAAVFQHILPYARACTRARLRKLAELLRAVGRQFPAPPAPVLEACSPLPYLDSQDGRWPEGAAAESPDLVRQHGPFLEVYTHLYLLLSQVEETPAGERPAGYAQSAEGRAYVERVATLLQHDLCYHPQRYDSWRRLATLYDEEVDLLLNDASKGMSVDHWRSAPHLAARVEQSRRRSIRALHRCLALSTTPEQKVEVHKLLGLVHYDAVQCVTPLYGPRERPERSAAWAAHCDEAAQHFAAAAGVSREWLHHLYLGKLAQKRGQPWEEVLACYVRAVELSPSCLDALYRLHATRSKVLGAGPEATDRRTLELLARHAWETGAGSGGGAEGPEEPRAAWDWERAFQDCTAALRGCLEGEHKHFHRARLRLAKTLLARGQAGDVESAKEELAFCFRTGQRPFAMNMWEIGKSVARKAARGPRRALEVLEGESSRKFVTAARKALLLYLELVERTRDVELLERVAPSLRADRGWSTCLEDLAQVAQGCYLRALLAEGPSQSGRLFMLFTDQAWSEALTAAGPQVDVDLLQRQLLQYAGALEAGQDLAGLEAASERLRRRVRSGSPQLAGAGPLRLARELLAAWQRGLAAAATAAAAAAAEGAADDSGTLALLRSAASLHDALLAEELPQGGAAEGERVELPVVQQLLLALFQAQRGQAAESVGEALRYAEEVAKALKQQQQGRRPQGAARPGPRGGGARATRGKQSPGALHWQGGRQYTKAVTVWPG